MGHSLLNLTELPRLQRTELSVLQLVSPSNRPIQNSNLPKKGISKSGPKTGPAERRYQSRSYKTGGPVQIVLRGDRHRQTPLNSEKTLFCERGGCLHYSVGKTPQISKSREQTNEGQAHFGRSQLLLNCAQELSLHNRSLRDN